MNFQIYNSDSINLEKISINSIETIITDPPYGINFQGHEWDKSLPNQKIWESSFNVLKPGAYMLVFSSIKLLHKVITNIENSGFIYKDILFWMHLNSMPKNRKISLDIDKELGVESKDIGDYKYTQGYRKNKPDKYYVNGIKKIKKP